MEQKAGSFSLGFRILSPQGLQAAACFWLLWLRTDPGWVCEAVLWGN